MRQRRAVMVVVVSAVALNLLGVAISDSIQEALQDTPAPAVTINTTGALAALETLEVKGRAPKTGYSRDQFGGGWAKVQGCSTRDIILYRDLQSASLEGECSVTRGVLNDPYTGKHIIFSKDDASAVQIDHVVALSDAWQKGAQQLTATLRKQLANDPLELLAVDGPANQIKGDGDAATWLPENKAFRCEYIERQIQVKQKYQLWVTEAEKQAMQKVLGSC